MKQYKTTDQDLDDIYNYIDYLLNRGQFLLVDAILKELCMYVKSPYHRKANLTRLEILGYLTITLAAKSKLNNRDFFYNNVKHLFTEKELKGLE